MAGSEYDERRDAANAKPRCGSLCLISIELGQPDPGPELGGGPFIDESLHGATFMEVPPISNVTIFHLLLPNARLVLNGFDLV